MTSKMRFQSAQLIAYLTDDLWLRLAGHSNRQMERLATGLLDAGVEFLNPPDVNMLFARVPDGAATRLEAAGLLFYRIGPGVIRLVTSWQTTDDDIDQTLECFASVLGHSA
ncbi:MAG: hypothetical protein HOJ85_10370 [Ilumatobacter sp.]|nr:hypothetical protein [Ilumatobacter sp.]